MSEPLPYESKSPVEAVLPTSPWDHVWFGLTLVVVLTMCLVGFGAGGFSDLAEANPVHTWVISLVWLGLLLWSCIGSFIRYWKLNRSPHPMTHIVLLPALINLGLLILFIAGLVLSIFE